MKLGQLIKGLKAYDLTGDPEREIQGLAFDSRRVKPGDLFVALRGHHLDGHDYLGGALKRGAAAVVVETFDGFEVPAAVVRVPDSRKALSRLAARFYDSPFLELNLIGITGTNGKTSTSYLLESILAAAGLRPGVIGTVNYRFAGKTKPAPVTTPESLDLMRLLREMADGGTTDVILEVSSHALDQGRTGDCLFQRAIFTNITRDHLDYHKTMDAYFEAKSRLFRGLEKGRPGGGEPVAVINGDDPRAEALVALTKARVVTYGLGEAWDVRAEAVSADRTGLKATLITPAGERVVRSSLLGEINLYNIMAAAAAAYSLNIDLDRIVQGIDAQKVIPGRLEMVANEGGLTLVVDYSHTPDALLKALKTLRPLVDQRIITVFGCGGDRDKGKRYEMGLAAGENSDRAVITSDNPRSEDPLSIMEQIEKGVRAAGLKRLKETPAGPSEGSGYLMEADRRKAIRMAVAMAGEKDLVLIAGKGHEDYQIVGGEKRNLDDRIEAALAVSERR
jgi:UDP-N-acetylmuramoyl-L-alanyl-D-glutamate--2,6-diaminopimelate ligase